MKYKDRIVLSFYPDDNTDMILLELINNTTSKRYRSSKIKDILYNYFKENYKKDFEIIKKNIENSTETEENSINIIKNIKKSNKDTINVVNKALNDWNEE
mgnify:CR=1 FL=1|jgi:Na+/phosphate symporter